MTYDVHAHVATMDNPKVAQMHADAEVFDPRTEVRNGMGNFARSCSSVFIDPCHASPCLLVH